MEQDLDPGSQVEDASDLALSLKRCPNAFILLNAFQGALILQGKLRSLVSDPHIDNGVVVLLVRRPRNRIERCHFDLRLPSRKQVCMCQRQLNSIQFKRMERLRNMGEMYGIGMQDGREFAVVCQQLNATPSD